MTDPHQGRGLPARPSLEHLKKEAKQRLDALRLREPAAKLADAQLMLARHYGFTSWRALHAALAPRPDDADPVGDWISQPVMGRIALHIRRAGEGYEATVDNPDYGLFGIAAQNLAVADGQVAFDLIHPLRLSHFEARWDVTEHAWVGAWTMGAGPMKASFRRGVFRPNPRLEGLDGVWRGRIGENGSRLILTVRTDRHGTYGWLDIPDRQPFRYPLRTLTRSGSTVLARLAQIGIEGELDAQGRTLAGRFLRGEESWPVVLRWEAEAAPAPQRELRLTPERLDAFAGVYQFEDERKLRIQLSDGGLVSEAEDGHRMPMIPVGEQAFGWPLFEGQAAFELGGDGRAAALVLNEDGHKRRAERVG